jgi:hypothetical protein
MPSTTPCALQALESCNSRTTRLYPIGRAQVPLCRQCSQRMGIRMIVDACLDGSDIESVFKDIMNLLAKERRPEKGARADED